MLAKLTSSGARGLRASGTRREVLIGAIAAGVSLAPITRAVAALLSGPASSATVLIEAFSSDGKSLGAVQIPRVLKTDAQWRQQLSSLAFEVTRQAGTERPFSGPYDEFYKAGLYHCICRNTTLYDSRTKFDSGTGWPSFFRPISTHNIVVSNDDSFGTAHGGIVPSVRRTYGSRVR